MTCLWLNPTQMVTFTSLTPQQSSIPTLSLQRSSFIGIYSRTINLHVCTLRPKSSRTNRIKPNLESSDRHLSSPCATIPALDTAQDFHQAGVNIARRNTSENMQSCRVGPHASITVREWKRLCNTIAVMTPMYVDVGYLEVGTINAVSK